MAAHEQIQSDHHTQIIIIIIIEKFMRNMCTNWTRQFSSIKRDNIIRDSKLHNKILDMRVFNSKCNCNDRKNGIKINRIPHSRCVCMCVCEFVCERHRWANVCASLMRNQFDAHFFFLLVDTVSLCRHVLFTCDAFSIRFFFSTRCHATIIFGTRSSEKVNNIRFRWTDEQCVTDFRLVRWNFHYDFFFTQIHSRFT